MSSRETLRVRPTRRHQEDNGQSTYQPRGNRFQNRHHQFEEEKPRLNPAEKERARLMGAILLAVATVVEKANKFPICRIAMNKFNESHRDERIVKNRMTIIDLQQRLEWEENRLSAVNQALANAS